MRFGVGAHDLASLLHNPVMRRLLLLAVALPLNACSTMTTQDEHLKWHAQRISALATEDGWLTLVGLDFLSEGESTIGNCGSATFSYSNCAEPIVGTFRVTGREVLFTPHGSAAAERLTADDEGAPSVIRSGSVSFTLVRRNGALALRVRDRESPTRTAFAGIELYPYDPAFTVEAVVTAAGAGETVAITNVMGFVEQQPVAGRLSFELLGQRRELVATAGSNGRLFVVFGDRTNGSQTYGGGRFMDVPAPASGRTVLDFNRAYNPPCSFTAFATCPLPPGQNRLDCEIPAGERAPSSGTSSGTSPGHS